MSCSSGCTAAPVQPPPALSTRSPESVKKKQDVVVRYLLLVSLTQAGTGHAGVEPGMAGEINSCASVADGKAIQYHTQNLAIAKEVDDRAGEGKTYGNLGNAHDSLGDFCRAIKYITQDLEIAKEMGDRAGEGQANLGNERAPVAGGLFPGDQVQHAGPGDCQGGGRPGEGGEDVREPWELAPGAGGFLPGYQVNRQRLEIAKEVGDRAGEGGAYGDLNDSKPSPTSKHNMFWQHR